MLPFRSKTAGELSTLEDLNVIGTSSKGETASILTESEGVDALVAHEDSIDELAVVVVVEYLSFVVSRSSSSNKVSVGRETSSIEHLRGGVLVRTVPLDVLNQLAGAKVPELQRILGTPRTGEDHVVLDVKGISADVRTIDAANRLTDTSIPDLDRVVPSSGKDDVLSCVKGHRREELEIGGKKGNEGNIKTITEEKPFKKEKEEKKLQNSHTHLIFGVVLGSIHAVGVSGGLLSLTSGKLGEKGLGGILVDAELAVSPSSHKTLTILAESNLFDCFLDYWFTVG